MTTEKMSVEQALECLEHSAGIVERQALATLRAELAGMKADAERLDWLETNRADIFTTMAGDEFAVQVESGEVAAGYAPTLREAIDRAREVG